MSSSQRSEFSDLIAQARTEGALSWIDSVFSNTTAQAAFSKFKKEYALPNLKMNFQRLDTPTIASQLENEVVSGKVTSDIVGTANPTLFPTLKSSGALVNWASPEAQYYRSTAKYVSDDFNYWISPDAYTFNIIVNPKLYPKPITSWYDLLTPALKGKVDIIDVAKGGSSAATYIGLRQVLPLSFWRQLAATGDPLSGGTSTLEDERVAQGQVDAAITSGFQLLSSNAQTGAGLKDYYPSQGVVMLGQTYAILKGSPDPAAAKLFDNFLLSVQGQNILVADQGVTPARNGVTVPANVKQYAPASLGGRTKVIPVDWSKITTPALNASVAQWKSIFH